jgi:hypothetical protein
MLSNNVTSVVSLLFEFLKNNNSWKFTKNELKTIFDYILPVLDLKWDKLDENKFSELLSKVDDLYWKKIKWDKWPLIEIIDWKVCLSKEGKNIVQLK